MIIPTLNRYQKDRGGYLTEQDLRAVASELQVPLYRIQELVTFYPHYRTTPPPCVEVHVCRDMACHLRGSVRATEKVKAWAHEKYAESQVHVSEVSCLGRCDRAPAALVNEQLYVLKEEITGAISPTTSDDWADKLRQVIDERVQAAESKTPLAQLTLQPASDWDIARPKIGTWDMDVYKGQPSNYQAVRNYFLMRDIEVIDSTEADEAQRQGDAVKPRTRMLRPAEQVIEALKQANLLGMGGAGGKAYEKWRDVWQAETKTGQKYIVCNADESEPGTFKDRDLLLAAPHLTIEGMILAGLLVGATRGWIYIRHEYPEQAQKLREEIQRAKTDERVLGDNICGSGKSFELEVFVSPGNYICGEQTALIEAMEDKRAEPRIRPPALSTNGYKDQPTLLNNVETFAWVPAIMLRNQGGWFADQGRKSGPFVGKSGPLMRGKRLLSISGDVRKPGAYEVPTGIPLRELIDDYCEGLLPGKSLLAVAMSGPSNGLLPAKIPVSLLKRDFGKYYGTDIEELDVLDIPLDINVARELGIMIGAGIVVYGSGCDLLAEALCLSAFFQRESCGKCVPCRIGSQKITEMGFDVLHGKVQSDQLPVLKDTISKLSALMKATSICGLGQVAHEPMRSVVRYFPELLSTRPRPIRDKPFK